MKKILTVLVVIVGVAVVYYLKPDTTLEDINWEVNNRVAYQTDMEGFGVEEHYQLPEELFERGRGDRKSVV